MKAKFILQLNKQEMTVNMKVVRKEKDVWS